MGSRSSSFFSAQISSSSHVSPTQFSGPPAAALGVLPVADASAVIIGAEVPDLIPLPLVQKEPLSKSRKAAVHKPSLRAPTPRRGRVRFGRPGQTAPGKNGSPRPNLGGDPIDRLGRDEDTPAFEDPDFEPEADDQRRDASAEELHSEGLGSEDQIDDPVRMYLMQMGEIPLLDAEWRKSIRPSASNSPAADFATACWPATICCTGPWHCWKKCATASCGSIAPSKCR